MARFLCPLYLFASFLSFLRNRSTFVCVLHPHWWTWVCAFIFYCLHCPSLVSFLLHSVYPECTWCTLLLQWFDCTYLGIFLNNVFVHSKFWIFTTNDVLCPYTKFDILASWRCPQPPMGCGHVSAMIGKIYFYMLYLFKSFLEVAFSVTNWNVGTAISSSFFLLRKEKKNKK